MAQMSKLWARFKARLIFQKAARSFKLPLILVRKAKRPTSPLNDVDADTLNSTLVDDDLDYMDKYDTPELDLETMRYISNALLPTTDSANSNLSFSLNPKYNDYDMTSSLPIIRGYHDHERPSRELCRFAWGADHTLVKQQALYLIVVQIRSGAASTMANVLMSGNDEKFQGLLVDLMRCLPGCWMEACRNDMHRTVQLAWCLDLPKTAVRHAHAATPLMEFLSCLIRSSESTAQTVLDAGFIDMLICMCSKGFRDPRMPNADTSQWNATTMLITQCALALEWLSKYPDICHHMKAKWYTLAEYWPRSHSWALSSWQPIPDDFSRIKSCRKESLRWIESCSSMINKKRDDALNEECIRLLHFSRRALNDTEVVNAAIRVLVTFICLLKHRVWVRLRHEMMRTSYHIIAELFFDIVGWLLSLNNGMPLTAGPYTPFLDFVDFLCGDSIVMKTAFEEAGIKSLGYASRSPSRARVVPVVSAHSRRNSLQDLDQDLDIESYQLTE